MGGYIHHGPLFHLDPESPVCPLLCCDGRDVMGMELR
jgi:hypothetical protein